MADISRENLVDTLEEIALLLELKGENPFKTRAYKNGADIVQNFDGDIVALAAANKLQGIKGIGEALQQKLHELASTGQLEYHTKLRAEFPETLFELFDLQGLGPKKIRILHEILGVNSIAELKKACEDGRVAKLKGFGDKTSEKILLAIDNKVKFADRFRLGSVAPVAEKILATLRDHPEVARAAIAGSYRRAKETLHDLDFLVATKKPKELTTFFTQLPEVHEIIALGDTKAAIRLENGLQCDLRAVSNAQFPFALQYFSGSKEHNVALRSLAQKQGLSLNEYDFTVAADSIRRAKNKQPAEIPEIHDEADIYAALKLDFIPPELRENRGEIEAAHDGKLPRLIEKENLRGTFHNHTRASDGAHSLAEMAQAAQDYGLSYFGIADHSKSSFQANGLNEARLRTQIEEIKTLNKTFGDGFQLLAGSEVDILKDGTLDFPDDLLAELDYCVASVHSVFNLSEKEMTARLLRAMENEHVTMLGHLSGRLLLKRDAYAVNHQKIIDCAAETRTVIELNCAPSRLDMDWRWWKKASSQGVLCAINPDAHHQDHLQFLHFGILQARKGWLSKENVLNTRPLAEIRRFLQTPKSQRV